MDKTYIVWIETLKQKIRAAQIKASVAVNVEMILLYWDIGKSIVEQQDSFEWGSKVVEQMARDLKKRIARYQWFLSHKSICDASILLVLFWRRISPPAWWTIRKS